MSLPADPHKILARISSHFIGEFILDEAIQKTFHELADLTEADRVYLYRIHHKAKLAHVTHEWLNPEINDINAAPASFSLSEYSWLISRLNHQDMLHITGLDELPAEAAGEKKNLKKQKIKSFIRFPLNIKNKLEGIIGLDFLGENIHLSPDMLETLKIAMDIIGFSVERKLSETSLRKTQWLYESIFENTGAATLIIRPDTSISMVNSEFERLSGYSRKEIAGRLRLIDLISKQDRPAFRQLHHMLICSPGTDPRKHEFVYITRDGSERVAYMTGSSLLDTKNCVVSFVDISDLKETEKQLILARNKAEESDNLKSAFLANVSHEIRTPLHAITGFSALLSNPDLHPDKKEKYIKQILNGSNELVNLIDNVLDISGMDSGTLKPKISEFPLNAKLEEMLAFYQDYKLQLDRENVDIRLTLPAGLKKLRIRTDKIRLQQILAQLMENAIKFTAQGRIEFGYSIESDTGNGSKDNSILFFVKDTGIGIAKNDINKVFERFVKIIGKNEQLYPGAGLGLALARDLVHLLGGEIWVESTYGKGSTFYFTIPHKQPSSVKKSTKKPVQGVPLDWSDKTILVAEDTESNYRYIEETLNATKARLIRARNGREAIEIFQSMKDEIDLVFMDILMPEYDGFEAAQEIRKIRNTIPVVAQTAFTFEGEFSGGLYAGCFNDYILKPFNIATIRDVMEKYLFAG